MKSLNFIKNWIEMYHSEREKGLRNARFFSLPIFLFVLFLFVLQIYALKQITDTSDSSISLQFLNGTIKALTFQITIVLGLFIRFLALKFSGRYALRFSEVGILIAFSAWLSHYIWTYQVISEIQRTTDLCFPPVLLYTPHLPASLLTLGFFGWVLYKIMFVIAVTWKTVRK
jgi:hypothetical protein